MGHIGRVEATDSVLVLGCGGVGLGAIAGAVSRGARVIALDTDDSKLSLAKALGARDAVRSGQDARDRVLALTGGDGPDVVIEAVGAAPTYRAAVEWVKFCGRVVYIGYAKEPVSYETRLFVQKELDIMGSRNALPQDFREVISLLDAGTFPVDRAVSAIVSVEDAPAALARWSENPASFTKIMVAL